MSATPPPPRAYPPQAPSSPPSRVKPWQVLTAIALGAFVGCIVVCGGGMILAGVYFKDMIQNNPAFSGGYNFPTTVANLSYFMSAPSTVQQGQPFEIELTLENHDTAPQTLHSLQNYSSLNITQSDPPWQSQQSDEFVYQMTLPPGQVQTIKLTAEAQWTGYESINIDAHLDLMGNSYAEAYHDLQVDPAP